MIASTPPIHVPVARAAGPGVLFRLAELTLSMLLLVCYAPLWLLHFLAARLRGQCWLCAEEVMGAGGCVVRVYRANPLGLAFFDHPVIAGSPLLWSVLRGHFSLVGPAPVTAAWVADATPRLLERLQVRPGLVSTWYVRSRVNIAFEDEAELALLDVRNRGFRQRFALLLKAVPALLFGSPQQASGTSINLFGLQMANLTRDEAVVSLLERAAASKRNRIAFVNPACVNIAMKHAAYHRVLQDTDLIFPDGIGLQIACKLTGQPLKDNLNGTDLYPALAAKMAETGQRLFLLGAKPGVVDEMATRAAKLWPSLRICGVQHGYYSPEEETAVVDAINASGADVLLVAMGVPQQELWIDRLLPRLESGVVMGVGGLFDFYSGRMPRAPLWMRETGLEWAYRLLKEPRRMWRRYLVGNLVFFWHLARKHRG